MTYPGHYAIITAVSPNLWQDYLYFYHSLRRYSDHHLYVIGLELPPELSTIIAQHRRVTLRPVTPEIVAGLKSIDEDWRKWYKPYFISLVPEVDYALWLDTDIVVAGSLDPLFAYITSKFLVVTDYLAPVYCRNSRELYELLQISTPPTTQVLNSGVIGWSQARDSPIIKRWLEIVRRANFDRIFYKNVSLHDQGALLLALHEVGGLNLILDKPEWNYAAKRVVPTPDRDILDDVIHNHPGITLIHYNGTPKLTDLCTGSEYASNHFRLYGIPTRWFITGCITHLRSLLYTLKGAARHGGAYHYDESAGLILADRHNTVPPQLYTWLNKHPTAVVASPHLNHTRFDYDNMKLIVIINDLEQELYYKLHQHHIFPSLFDRYPGAYQAESLNAARFDRNLDIYNNLRQAQSDLATSYLTEISQKLDQDLTRAQQRSASIVWADHTLPKQVVGILGPQGYSQSRLLMPVPPSPVDWMLEFVTPLRPRLREILFRALLDRRLTPMMPDFL